MRGAGRRGDEEELVQLRGLKETLGPVEFFLAHDGRGLAEVDPWSDISVQQPVALEGFAHGDGIVFGVEGADDAAQGRER